MTAPVTQVAAHLETPTRVAFVLPQGNGVGGLTSWSQRLAGSLFSLGLEPILLEHDAAALPARPMHDAPGPRRLPVPGPRPLYVSEQDVRRFVGTYRAVLPGVLVPNVGEGAYGAAAALARSDAESLRVIGYAHADHRYYYELLAYYEPIIHTFVVVSPIVGERLAARIPARAADIVMRPYGIPIGASPTRRARAPGEPLRLLYGGRLIEAQKRVHHLIELAVALSERGAPFEMRLVGEGPARSDLERLLATCSESVRARVSICAPVLPKEMPALWDWADVCLLVSDHEGISISMLEAMARGCIPVVTRTSGTELVIAEGVSGFTVPVDRPLAMVDVLAGLAAEPGRLARVGVAARAAVSERCSQEAYAAWFVERMQEAWTKAPRPWPSRRALVIPPGVEGSTLLRLASRLCWAVPGLYGPARRYYRRRVDV